MIEQPAAPLPRSEGFVLPEWIDYNGHMMDGYYSVAFTGATDRFLEALGFGPAYRERTGCTIYTVEGHINYLREVAAGAPLTFVTQLLDHDEKRIHLFHSMTHGETGELLATTELMFVHLDQATGRVTPIPPDLQERIAEVAAVHALLPRPGTAGRNIGIRRR